MNSVVCWPGKILSPQEEAAIRALPTNMRKDFEKYLPESNQQWTPDQYEAGAHIGPWTDFTVKEPE